MKRHKRGQGLVEYALILVLVAIVVIAILPLVGPDIGVVFCQIVDAITQVVPIRRVVSMDPSDNFVTFDAHWSDWEEDAGSGSRTCYRLFMVEDVGEPSHGRVENLEFAAFTYWPTDPGSETDDSFTFRWHYEGPFRQSDSDTGLVTIIVGEPDLAMSQSNILGSAMESSQEKKPPSPSDDVREDIFDLFEETEEQKEKFQEGVDLAVEAVEEGLEVLIEFADDSANSLLSESLSQLLQEVKDGGLDAVPEVMAQIGTDLAGAPLEVWLDMMLKMAPRLIKSCVVVSEGSVSPDMIDRAVQAVQGLDEDHPGKAEALQLLQIAVATIEERNNAAQEYTDFQSELLESFVAGFELAGEEDLAAQLAADSEACGN